MKPQVLPLYALRGRMTTMPRWVVVSGDIGFLHTLVPRITRFVFGPPREDVKAAFGLSKSRHPDVRLR
jgi:hypothetical protein